jgi:hypothetical protein
MLGRTMWLSALLALATLSSPASSGEQVAIQIRDGALWASFEVEGWRHDAALETRLSEQYGRGALTAGRWGKASATLREFPDAPHRTSAQWRSELGSGEPFEVDGIACAQSEQRLPSDQGSMVRFSAFPVAGGHAFLLHVNAPKQGQSESCSRAQFETLVRSWRVQYVRRGTPAELTSEPCTLLSAALHAWPDWLAPLERAETTGTHSAGVLAFVRAEVMAFDPRTTPRDATAASESTLALLRAVEQPSAAEQVALALCEDALGTAQLDGGSASIAGAHLARAKALTEKLGHSGRAEIGYDLARALARQLQDDVALDELAQAIALRPRLMLVARAELDFARFTQNERFRKLLGLADER